MIKTVFKKFTDVKPIADFDLVTSALIRENNLPINSKEDFDRLFPDKVNYCDSVESFCNTAMKPLINRDKFVEKIANYDRNKHICVALDYDCDGICAGIIMIHTLKLLGFTHVEWSVPDRLTGSYGIDIQNIKKADLYITVDTGISEKEKVEELRNKFPEAEIIITDHHLPTEGNVPEGCLLIDPKYNNDESSDICGAYVAFKLAVGLFNHYTMEIPEVLLVLAGIATVGDMMPVLGENRQIINLALDYINTVRDLYKVKDPIFHIVSALGGYNYMRSSDWATEDLIAFYIAPSFNAVSRVYGKVDDLVKNILEVIADPQNKVMGSFETANFTRRDQTKILYDDFKKAYIPSLTSGSIVYFFDQVHYSFTIKGMCGLIANKISNEQKKVAFIGSYNKIKETTEGVSHYRIDFSARSVPGYNLHDGIERIRSAHPEFELEGGGHALAMGVSLLKIFLSQFIDALEKDIAENSLEVEDVIYDYDSAFESEIINGLGSLAPFGTGFRKLKFVYTGTFKKFDYYRHEAEIGDYIFRVFLPRDVALGLVGQQYSVVFSVNYNEISGPIFNVVRS